MNEATKTNPTAGYIVFESGEIVFESGELKPAIEFCMDVPGRAVYGSMCVNKQTVRTTQRGRPIAATENTSSESR